MEVYQSAARTILSHTSGFIAAAGFTHSLSPARNCTYGCVYCYVPTLRVFAGLKREDWERWGQFTTFKSNAADLLQQELRPQQRIYCSPLVDPYQPAEAEQQIMPRILAALIDTPPAVFTIQTRGPLIERDVSLLQELHTKTKLRISFSITTNRDDIRRLYEPHCETNEQRLRTIRHLKESGLNVHATLAPLLPCDPEILTETAIEATNADLVGDPLHIRLTKATGATTRKQAFRVADAQDHGNWFDPAFQTRIVERIRRVAEDHGRRFATGTEGFSWLAQI
jgi:DNA repair photolyase